MLNSPSNLSFKFGAKFTEMDKKFTLARNAIDELTNRVNAIPTVNIDELDSKITANTEDIAYLSSTKADISYVNDSIAEVSTRVDSNETNIDSLETNLEALTTRVDSNETDIDSLETNLEALTTRVTTNEGNIEKHGEWIDNLVSSVAGGKTDDSINNFYKYLFDMIYPIGSIYTTVTDTPPPNIYDISGNKYATWELLADGRFLRNTQNNNSLGSIGGTAVTQLPAHTHDTKVTIDGKLYSASRGDTGPASNDTNLVNCGLFAPKETGNAFYSENVVTQNDVAINWSDTSNDDVKNESRATSSSVATTAYFPITLKVDKDYTTNSESTTASNKKVNVITGNELPDNCPPFMYVKMYKRTG